MVLASGMKTFSRSQTVRTRLRLSPIHRTNLQTKPIFGKATCADHADQRQARYLHVVLAGGERRLKRHNSNRLSMVK